MTALTVIRREEVRAAHAEIDPPRDGPGRVPGLAERDAALAMRHLDPRYVEHDPHVGDGVEGVRRHVAALAPGDHLEIVRVFEDGDLVVAQSNGRVRGDGVFFDVFRFEGWGFATPAGPPNRSGHTLAFLTRDRTIDELRPGGARRFGVPGRARHAPGRSLRLCRPLPRTGRDGDGALGLPQAALPVDARSKSIPML